MRELVIYFAVHGMLIPHDPDETPVGLQHLKSANPGYPSNWRAGCVGDVFTFEYGDNLPAPKRSQTGEYPVYGSNGIVGTHRSCLTQKPAIIVGRKGSAGALNLATGPSWTTDVAYYVVPPKDLDLRFTYYLFSALRFDTLGKGIKPGLSRKEAYALTISLPPLAEQKRIVAKVDELMALCDQLEAQQQERDKWHASLARASLARFADSPTPANLNFLFHKSYDIELVDLRKSILTLAVQGKLEPQEGKWGNAKLQDVASEIVDCPHSTPKWTTEGVICVRTNQFRPGYLDLSTSRFVSEQTYKERIKRIKPIANDILYSREGGILGVACRVPPKTPLCLGQRMMLIRAGDLLTPSFLEMVLNSPLITEIARKKTTGGAAPRVNVSTVRAYPIPIPCLAEQRRIVAKVDQLMALVDELETQLASSRATAKNLLEALVAELSVTGVSSPMRAPTR